VAKDLPKKSTSRASRPRPRKKTGRSARPGDVQRLEQAVAARERELAILADVATRVHGQEDVQAILDQTLNSLVEGLELRTAWILLEDQKDGQLRLAAHRGVAPAYLERIERDGLDRCLCPEVFSSGHSMMARNTTDCPRMPTIGEGLEQPVAHACVPLAFDGMNQGVLNVAAPPDEVFADEELRFLETVGRQVCLAVEGARHLKAQRLHNQEARALALENARLYDNARRAYRELNEAQARIIQSEKMAVVGTFASGLAHEVRNPLNSIALQLSILERRVAPLPSGVAEEIKGLLGIIREEVRRLDNLVGDFLQFSRSNRIQYRPVSLDSLVDEVMRLLRPEARAAGVTLRRERIGDPTPNLWVDPEKIKQVSINLVQNAIEALPQGGEVVVESGCIDGRALMIVRDDGPGLPEGLDVFQLFVTTKAHGTGLGLSIAQQIVLEHGGEIEATSKPGGGATVTVSLPVERPDSEAAGEEP
jgi:signal transduction histidine kinase